MARLINNSSVLKGKDVECFKYNVEHPALLSANDYQEQMLTVVGGGETTPPYKAEIGFGSFAIAIISPMRYEV